MTGVTAVRSGENDVYEATAVVEGGQLVVPGGAATNPGKVGIVPASAGATNVLGVAARRAEPVDDQNLASTDGDGYPVVYANPVNELTTVYKQRVVEVNYNAAAVGYGDKLVAANAGAVKAYTAGTDDPSLIVGECRVVGGMGAGGGKGLALIY